MAKLHPDSEITRDYCTSIPDTVKGIFIGACCRQHDNMVGQAGDFNPIKPHIRFYRCLRKKGLNVFYSFIITTGGALFSLIKYPYFVVKKIMYRRK